MLHIRALRYIQIDRELYLATLTLSTEADFHRGRVTRKLQW